jgi:hypothetical protein
LRRIFPCSPRIRTGRKKKNDDNFLPLVILLKKSTSISVEAALLLRWIMSVCISAITAEKFSNAIDAIMDRARAVWKVVPTRIVSGRTEIVTGSLLLII